MSFEDSNSIEYDFANEEENEADDTTDNKTINILELPIEDLIARRDRYISELKLEKAQEVDAIIDYIQSVAHEGPVEKVKNYLTSKFNELFDQYKDKCEKLTEESNEQETEIRKEGDDVFMEMKARHIEQLLEIEKMRAYEIVFNKNKPVKRALIYERQARYSAKQKEYEKAFHFRQQANQEKERVLNERRSIIEEKMSNLKTNVLVSMRSEMKVLAEKIQDQIKSNQALLSEELDLQMKTFKVAVNNEVQKAIFGLNNYFTKNETKNLLSNEISNFSDEKLKEITGMDMNITLLPAASPSKNQKAGSQQTSPRSAQSPAQPGRTQNTTKQQTNQTTPRQKKQRRQQTSPKPATSSKQTNSPKPPQPQQTTRKQDDEETSNLPENQQQPEIVEDSLQQQQQQEELEQKPEEQQVQLETNEDSIQNQINEITGSNEETNANTNDANQEADDFDIDNLIDQAKNENNENGDDFNFENMTNSAGNVNNENNANDSIDALLLNGNSNNNSIELNLDNGTGNDASIGIGSEPKSNTDDVLDNLLNGDNDNDDDLLAALGVGSDNKKKNTSDSILDIGED